MARAQDAISGIIIDAPRRAAGFAVMVLCLLLTTRLSDVLYSHQPGQVPFTVALFVIPLLCAVPGTWRRLDRRRWPVLATQGLLTWVPFAVFGAYWQIGIGGLLAGLVLLTIRGRVSWLIAGLLLAAEVTVRAALTGLLAAPAWIAVLDVVTFYVDDALVFFGLVRLAQVVGEIENARRQAADLAVARERLQAAQALQAAVGRRLAIISAKAAAARRALSRDAARARAQVAEAGVTAREAIAQARAVAAARPSPLTPEPAAPPDTGAVIGARLAWAVLVTVLLMYAAENSGYAVNFHLGARLMGLAAGGIVLTVALQLYHSGAARQGRRPRAWPLTLALQAVLVYAFVFPFIRAYVGDLGPFLAGSVLLLVPGRWRWAGFAAVVASYPVLRTVLPLRGNVLTVGTAGPDLLLTLFAVAITAELGLLVYGLSRLAGLARELAGLRGELARAAAVRERLRVARDVHDLLGLGLSAIALKTDLIGRLIGRDDARAAAEIGELGRICVSSHADIRLVTGDGQRLSLAAELAAARQILTPAGIEVRADIAAGPLPGLADEVLAPVLREAITNILRHSVATACVIEVTSGGGVLRLQVSNDGAVGPSSSAGPAERSREGCGLANLTARVQAVGGRLASGYDGEQFHLITELPASGPLGAKPAAGAGPHHPTGLPAARPAGSRQPGSVPRRSL